MLVDAAKAWGDTGLFEALHLERFGATFVGGKSEGDTVRFAASGVSTTVDGATTPDARGRAGWRPDALRLPQCICHTCVVLLTDGSVRDLYTGIEHRANHQTIQIRVTVAAGACVLDA